MINRSFGPLPSDAVSSCSFIFPRHPLLLLFWLLVLISLAASSLSCICIIQANTLRSPAPENDRYSQPRFRLTTSVSFLERQWNGHTLCILLLWAAKCSLCFPCLPENGLGILDKWKSSSSPFFLLSGFIQGLQMVQHHRRWPPLAQTHVEFNL